MFTSWFVLEASILVHAPALRVGEHCDDFVCSRKIDILRTISYDVRIAGASMESNMHSARCGVARGGDKDFTTVSPLRVVVGNVKADTDEFSLIEVFPSSIRDICRCIEVV